jgi:acetyl-CoA synthetase
MVVTSIPKPRTHPQLQPNLGDYEGVRAAFDWQEAEQEMLDGLPGGGVNIAHEAVDRHAAGARADHVALRWLGRDGSTRDLTYAELAQESSRFAGLLRQLGIDEGARVFLLTGRIPDLYVAALGTLKAKCVLSPLFAAFGPEPIQARLSRGEAAALVTTPALYRRKVEPIRDEVPTLEHVLLAGSSADASLPARTLALDAALEGIPDDFNIPPTDPESPALLHFTSGTTGLPKGRSTSTGRSSPTT